MIDNDRYACKYKCPQIFCFDGYNFLILQFRAQMVAQISDAKIPVDCWVIPRNNVGGTSLRYALYRLILQGYRRCQAIGASMPKLGGMQPVARHFYNGQLVWKGADKELTYDHPLGFSRAVYTGNGMLYWAVGGEPATDEKGNWIWDSVAFWEEQGAYVEENLVLQQTYGFADDGIPRDELYD